MKCEPLEIQDSYLIVEHLFTDERGMFSRSFCIDELKRIGIEFSVCQINDSFSKQKGTFRGFHMQVAPFSETKIVKVVNGSIIDFILDLRSSSETYLSLIAVELNGVERQSVMVPKGCAHAFLTTSDDTRVVYLSDAPYTPSAEIGVRFNDPVVSKFFDINAEVVSKKDSEWPSLKT